MVVPPAAAAPRIADAEELAPLQLFQQYAEARSLAPEVGACRPFKQDVVFKTISPAVNFVQLSS